MTSNPMRPTCPRAMIPLEGRNLGMAFISPLLLPALLISLLLSASACPSPDHQFFLPGFYAGCLLSSFSQPSSKSLFSVENSTTSPWWLAMSSPEAEPNLLLCPLTPMLGPQRGELVNAEADNHALLILWMTRRQSLEIHECQGPACFSFPQLPRAAQSVWRQIDDKISLER